MGTQQPDTVELVMTPDPIAIDPSTSVRDAALAMREADVGDVLVVDDGVVTGIVTDRDIAVRAVASGANPLTTPVSEICSHVVFFVAPDDPIDRALELMREHAVRRIPVVRDGHAVGIVCLGDIVIDRDPTSALAGISAAPPNA